MFVEMEHRPVLLDEVVSYFDDLELKFFCDCTLGCGGHSLEILKKHKETFLIGVDADSNMLKKAKNVLSDFSERISLWHKNYKFVDEVLNAEGIKAVDGFLLDLGMSSVHLDSSSRGFSFKNNSVLDMRYDTSKGITAFDVVNSFEKEELKKIFKLYGEEKFSYLIASAIVKKRRIESIKTSDDLYRIIESVLPKGISIVKTAARIFQALRIYVNSEIDNLKTVLPKLIKYLKVGGRIAIISFHSIEDRIVKNFGVQNSKTCICPENIPYCVCGRKPSLKVLTKKPVCAGKEEISQNPRARSAKLRVFEKIGGD